MVAEFECIKCGRVYSVEEYEKDRFCRDCGTFLKPKRLKIIISEEKKEPREIRKDDINLDSLFYEYIHDKVKPFSGVPSVPVETWVIKRKQAYREYQGKFHPDNLHDLEKVAKNYKDWLQFKNNLSWTTLHRTGYYALETKEKLADLLWLLQDETIDVGERVRLGLESKYKVRGIGQGILTAFLHTFNPDNYGVWNIRTKETLEILRRKPIQLYSNLDIGKKYKKVNSVLVEMAKELNTDLTTIDGFMWYISKEIRFI